MTDTTTTSLRDKFEISKTSFLNVPVTGEYNTGTRWGRQLRPAEFAALIQPVLDDEEIVSFGWTQFTPFYNDDDTCAFAVDEPWFLTREDLKTISENLGYRVYSNYTDFDPYNLCVNNKNAFHPSIGGVHDAELWDPRARDWKPNPRAGQFTGQNRTRFDNCFVLANALNGTSCNSLLLEAFGEHAAVRFTRDPETNEWAARRKYHEHD